MCGHVGMVGIIQYKDEKMFKDLLKMDVIRGHHATGITSLRRNVTTQQLYTTTAKAALDAYDFLGLKSASDAMTGVLYMLLGHNRHATRGAIVDENSHPFDFQHIVGAHNGSLTTYTKMHDASKYSVDSQALYAELNENGVDSMWGKVQGAASLVWYDKRTNRLNMLRNSQRPMCYTTMNNGRTLVWASEPWMLHAAAYRNDVLLDDKPVATTVNMLNEFTFPTSYADKGVVEVATREVKPFIAPPVQAYYRPSTGTVTGKALLEKENAKIGDSVCCTITKITDYFAQGRQKATVHGLTDNGTPVVIYCVDVDTHDDMLNAMWEKVGQLFSMRITAAYEKNLVCTMEDAHDLGFTITEMLEAMEEQDVADLQLEFKDNVVDMQPVLCSHCAMRTTDYHVLGDNCVCKDCIAHIH